MDKDRLLNVPEIVMRAKAAMGFKTDAELAAYLGISRSTLCNWSARNSIDFPLLLEKLKEVDYNWLLVGKGSPMHRQRRCEVDGMAGEKVTGEVEMLHNPKTAEPLDDRSVSLYDITAAANLKTMLACGAQFVVGKIMIPSIPRCDGAVYVSGDSMYPLLKSGDIIGFKEISDLNYLIFGEIYLISYHTNDGNDYLAVKYVNRSEKPGCIKLVSYNTHHEPMDLPMENIQAIGIVKFSVRKNMIM